MVRWVMLTLAVLLAGTAGGCAFRPTPLCKGEYRPFDSNSHCHEGG